jgi:chromosome segregation ATPase
MLLNLVICAATVFALSALFFERRRRALEARMTQEVRERYAAYVDLEQRVLAALGEFDCLETSFEIEIRKSREQIRNLEEALNAVEGLESVVPETPGGFLGVLDEGDANVQAQPITLTGEARDFEAELQQWERKVESTQAEKRNEIERQRQQIGELTERLRHLEPTSAALRQRDEALAQARQEITRYEAAMGVTRTSAADGAEAPSGAASDLEQRLERADASARELAETLASCKPLVEQQARARARGAELERERARLEKACASLEERCGALDAKLRERERELEQAQTSYDQLEARDQESARSLASAHQELTTLRHDLENERQHAERERERAERESLACEELQRARDELARGVAALDASLEAEGVRSAGLTGQLESARRQLEQFEKQCAQLEASGHEQAAVVQAQGEMLHAREEEIERLRNRIGTLETKLTSTRDTLGGQKSRLGELLEAIEVTQKEQDRHKVLLSEQSAHMQEARKLLDLLRPAMDQLEGELEKKHTT